MKTRSVGAEVLYVDRQKDERADGRTNRQIDTTKLKVAFRSFANATNNGVVWTLILGRIPVIKIVHKIPFGTSQRTPVAIKKTNRYRTIRG